LGSDLGARIHEPIDDHLLWAFEANEHFTQEQDRAFQ